MNLGKYLLSFILSLMIAATAFAQNPDFDGNGAVEPADVSAYVNAWNAALQAHTVPPAIDLDHDGALTPSDIALFVQAWNAANVAGSGGWTNLTASSDTRKIYISYSTGSDNNDGLSERFPKRSIAAGEALMRYGYPDWLLLKKGDTWPADTFGAIYITGRSAAEPALFGAYGTGTRPKMILPVGGTNGISRYRTYSNGKLAIIGLHFQSAVGDEYNQEGISWLGGPDYTPDGGTDILIEDCRFTKLFRGCDIQGVTNLTIRRCVFEDMGSRQSSGYSPCSTYCGLSNNVTVEENYSLNKFFTYGVRDPYIQDSVYYLQDELLGTIVFRRNITIYQGNYGPVGTQMRCTGSIRDNIYWGCHTGIDLGQVSNGNFASSGIGGDVTGNIIQHGLNMNSVSDRAIGIIVSNTAPTFTISNNIISGKAAISGGTGLDIDPSTRGPIRGLTLSNNILYNWNGIQTQQGSYGVTNMLANGNEISDTGTSTENPSVDIYSAATTSIRFTNNAYTSTRTAGQWFTIAGTNKTNPQWLSNESTARFSVPAYRAPSRTLITYGQSLGFAGNIDAISSAMLRQSRDTWDNRLTATAILSHIRDGFAH